MDAGTESEFVSRGLPTLTFVTCFCDAGDSQLARRFMKDNHTFSRMASPRSPRAVGARRTRVLPDENEMDAIERICSSPEPDDDASRGSTRYAPAPAPDDADTRDATLRNLAGSTRYAAAPMPTAAPAVAASNSVNGSQQTSPSFNRPSSPSVIARRGRQQSSSSFRSMQNSPAPSPYATQKLRHQKFRERHGEEEATALEEATARIRKQLHDLDRDKRFVLRPGKHNLLIGFDVLSTLALGYTAILTPFEAVC